MLRFLLRKWVKWAYVLELETKAIRADADADFVSAGMQAANDLVAGCDKETMKLQTRLNEIADSHKREDRDERKSISEKMDVETSKAMQARKMVKMLGGAAENKSKEAEQERERARYMREIL